jgi:hypothetical protein
VRGLRKSGRRERERDEGKYEDAARCGDHARETTPEVAAFPKSHMHGGPQWGGMAR